MLLQQEKILTLLDRALNQTAKVRKGADAVYFCPKCNHYKRKLEINMVSGKYNCWVCNFRGTSIISLFRKLGVSAHLFSELERIGAVFTTTEYRSDDTVNEVCAELPREFQPFFRSKISIEYRNALHYIRQRNIDKLDILRYNIGYCEEGEFRNRVVIPSYDASGKLNFFSARDYYNTSQLAYKLCQSNKNIIGFESLINFDEPITLVEGQFDAMALKFNAIPLFGKTMSMELKLKLISSDIPRVNVVLDNDALRESMEICKYLMRHNIPVHLVQLDGKDPSSMGFKQSWELINNTPELNFDRLIQINLNV